MKTKHYIVDFQKCNAEKLANRNLHYIFVGLLIKHNIKRLNHGFFHKFTTGGKGVTGFIPLCTSHVAYHTYPEKAYMAFDIYMCAGGSGDKFIKDVAKYIESKSFKKNSFLRG